jgi:hypothetical protein
MERSDIELGDGEHALSLSHGHVAQARDVTCTSKGAQELAHLGSSGKQLGNGKVRF